MFSVASVSPISICLNALLFFQSLGKYGIMKGSMLGHKKAAARINFTFQFHLCSQQGVVFYTPNFSSPCRLPKYCSIAAILLALGHMAFSSQLRPSLISSDSFSALLALLKFLSPNPVVQRILLLLYFFTSRLLYIYFVSIPRHIEKWVGKPGCQHCLYNSLFFPNTDDHLLDNWFFENINAAGNLLLITLRLIKSIVFPWPSSYLSSHTKETTLSDLPIEHLPLTHSYLHLSLFNSKCPFWHASRVTVSYLLLNCQTLIPPTNNTIFPLLDLFCYSSPSLPQ